MTEIEKEQVKQVLFKNLREGFSIINIEFVEKKSVRANEPRNVVRFDLMKGDQLFKKMEVNAKKTLRRFL